TTGGCQFLGRRLISWQCKKQTIVATSSTEAEYVAAASCRGQVLWIQNQLLDYGLHTAKTFDLVWVWLGGDYENVFLNGFSWDSVSEHNIDFHPMVDFIAASPLRYALTFKPTIYVSHIRQFWSTARIETTEEGTQILATVDGVLRTVTESSLRRNLKLQDEEGINSLPDTELFENLTLMGYNISPNQKFTFQKGFNEFSSNIATAHVFLATNRTYNFSKMIFDGVVKNDNNKLLKFLMYPSPSFSGRTVPLFDAMLVHQGKGSGTPTEPHHIPSPEAQTPSYTTHPTSSLPPVTTTSTPTVTPTETTPIRHYTRRTRIAQSSVPLTIVDELAYPQRDVIQGEAYPTDFGFIVDQDRTTIAKSSTLPYDSAPRVTSPAAEVEINQLKERVKLLEEREGAAATNSGDDAPIKGRSIDEGEAVVERVSDDTEEMATVLTSMDAATVLASGVVNVSTGSGSIPTASTLAEGSVPTGSEEVPTASPVFSIATVVTPYRRRKGKEVMVKSETPNKQKLQEQIDAQIARELKEQLEREDQRRSEQIARDEEIARTHAE
nr:putative reverse transcriptase, RNA-dependent DNA polymerase [Tanacetum cinerariifolium]